MLKFYFQVYYLRGLNDYFVVFLNYVIFSHNRPPHSLETLSCFDNQFKKQALIYSILFYFLTSFIAFFYFTASFPQLKLSKAGKMSIHCSAVVVLLVEVL